MAGVKGETEGTDWWCTFPGRPPAQALNPQSISVTVERGLVVLFPLFLSLQRTR